MITPTSPSPSLNRTQKRYIQRQQRRIAVYLQKQWKHYKLKRKPSPLTRKEMIDEEIFRQHYILDFEAYLKDSIHDHQWRDAKEIYLSFTNPWKLLVNLIKQPQEGKTGMVVALLYIIATNDKNFKYSLRHTYYITGVSSTEWVGQQKHRFPGCFSNNILHRPELTKRERLHQILTQEKNPFIIIDEPFWAAGSKQTFGNILKDTYKDKQMKEEFAKYNVKLLLTSATPDGTLPDTRKDYGDQAVILVPDPEPEYWGPEKWINTLSSHKRRLFEYQDLNEDINIMELRGFIGGFYSTCKYHCIRIHGGGKGDHTMQKIQHIFGPDFAYYEFNEGSKHDSTFLRTSNDNIADINVLLEQKPHCQSIVFVKEKARCSTTLVKTHLGVVYERLAKNPKTTIINQGLIGRCNGYDVNEDVVVFTDIDEVKRYIEYRDRIKNGSEKTIPITSNTTGVIFDKIKKKNETKSKKTYLDENAVKKGKMTRTLPSWKVVEFPMKSTDTLKDFVKKQIDKWLVENNSIIYGHEARKKPLVKRISGYSKNDEGFWYLDTNYNKDRDGVFKIYGKLEINTDSKELRNGQNNNPTRLFPTYDDPTNPNSTCTWKLFYREP